VVGFLEVSSAFFVSFGTIQPNKSAMEQ